MTKFTAGPWAIREVEHNPQRLNIQETSDFGYEIASVWGGGALDDAILANARLIAAAPELIQALEYLCRYAKTDGINLRPHDFAVVQALAALAKARGE